MNEMTNRAIVKSSYEAVGEKAVVADDGVKRGDVDHLQHIFAEDIELIHPALGGAFHGADSVINDIPRLLVKRIQTNHRPPRRELKKADTLCTMVARSA